MHILRENEFLVVSIPVTSKAFVFRVKAIQNGGYQRFRYGPIPLKSGEIIDGLEGGTVTVPADGVMPGMSVTRAISFPYEGTYDSTDMWYVPEEYRDRIFHVIHKYTPSWLRIELQIPRDISQMRFQRDKVTGGADSDFGFSRGMIEVVHFPEVYYGFIIANDTNVDVYTYVEFIYGELIIEIPRDPELIFNILNRKIQSHWVTLPISYMAIDRELRKTYGFDGFPLYGLHQKQRALETYRDLLRAAKV